MAYSNKQMLELLALTNEELEEIIVFNTLKGVDTKIAKHVIQYCKDGVTPRLSKGEIVTRKVNCIPDGALFKQHLQIELDNRAIRKQRKVINASAEMKAACDGYSNAVSEWQSKYRDLSNKLHYVLHNNTTDRQEVIKTITNFDAYPFYNDYQFPVLPEIKRLVTKE